MKSTEATLLFSRLSKDSWAFLHCWASIFALVKLNKLRNQFRRKTRAYHTIPGWKMVNNKRKEKDNRLQKWSIPVMKNLLQNFPSTFHCRSVLKMNGLCFFHVDCPFSFNRRRGILHGWHFLLQSVSSSVCTFPEFMHCHLHLKNVHQVKITLN